MVTLVAATAERSDVSAYVRGKLFVAGVGHDTPIRTALDVIQVMIMDVPVEELEKWRRQFNASMWRIRPPDRATWGLLPGQVEAAQRLAGGGGPAPRPSRGSRGHSR